MQRGIAGQHTSHLNRFQTRRRRNRPGAPDLNSTHRAQSHPAPEQENLNATAQRGARAAKPNCSCKASELTLITTPCDIKTERWGSLFDVVIKIQYRTGRIAHSIRAIADGNPTL